MRASTSWLPLIVLSGCLWSSPASAGDYITVIVDSSCRREDWKPTPRPSFISADVFAKDIGRYFASPRQKDTSPAYVLANGHMAFCGVGARTMVYQALLSAAVQPKFFHERDFMNAITVQGTKSLLTLFDDRLQGGELSEAARARLTEARDALREKFRNR